MDFTETPHAEDFAMELSELLGDYYRRPQGLSVKDMKRIFDICIEEDYMFEPEDDA